MMRKAIFFRFSLNQLRIDLLYSMKLFKDIITKASVQAISRACSFLWSWSKKKEETLTDHINICCQ